MKKIIFAGLAFLGALSAFAVEYKVEDWNLEARKKFAEQRFGVYFHWGLYANYAQGEWYLKDGKVNEEAYSRMMYGFYPSKFNAREWVKVVKNAGAKYIT
ncbi:MAG: alpha-L-fucosidase, partial [Kiritimatiellae bacterium]|nr:alpha-L-fucosidase [Kiritimatiellia bacterium]